MSTRVTGDYVKGTVGESKNTIVGKSNTLENHEIPVTINNNVKPDADANLDAIRLALFGDTKLNFKGLIMRLDDIESQLHAEIVELRNSIRILEYQIQELKQSLTVKNTHLIVSSLNLLLIAALFAYLFSQ